MMNHRPPLEQSDDHPSASALASRLDGVEGWLSPLDAALFELIDAVQGARDMTGDILEIGAYKGKSAIVLGACLAAGERLSVCDLFGSADVRAANTVENLTHYAHLGRQEFERNYLRFHRSLPEIHQCPSSDLGARLTPGSFRLVHVDGSHLFEEVRSDIALTRTLTRPGGIVAFDDVHNEGQPGVGAAIWNAVVADRLRPRVVSHWKLYAAWDEEGVQILDDVVATLRSRSDIELSGPLEIADEIMWRVDSSPDRSRVRQRLRDWVPPALYRAASRAKKRLRRGTTSSTGRSSLDS